MCRARSACSCQEAARSGACAQILDSRFCCWCSCWAQIIWNVGGGGGVGFTGAQVHRITKEMEHLRQENDILLDEVTQLRAAQIALESARDEQESGRSDLAGKVAQLQRDNAALQGALQDATDEVRPKQVPRGNYPVHPAVSTRRRGAAHRWGRIG